MTGLMVRSGTASTAILALTMILLTGADAMAQSNATRSERTVSVSATGSVTAEPDMAAISTGVTSDAATAREALTANNFAMSRLIEGVKSLAIDPKDIRTSGLAVSPRYEASKDGRTSTIRGYQASNQLRVTVRDLKRLAIACHTRGLTA